MAFHAAVVRREWTARDVVVRFARCQDWLFANDTITFNKVDHAAPISDPPVPRKQLDSLVRVILNPDVVDPEPLSSLDSGLFRQEIHRHADGNAVSDRSMLEQFFHNGGSVAAILARDNTASKAIDERSTVSHSFARVPPLPTPGQDLRSGLADPPTQH